MKKFLLSILICLGIVGAGAGVTYRVWAIRLANPDELEAKEEKLPNVAIQVLHHETVNDMLYLTGAVDPWEAVTISAETTGKIEWQGVEEGDTVSKDDELVRVNMTSVKARVAQARAELNLAEQEHKRIGQLREGGLSSPQEYDRVTTNREAAQANVDLAQIDLDNSVVAAYIEGVVDQLFHEEGEFVTAGKPLVRIVQIAKVKILIGVPERDVMNFTPGDPVRVAFDAYPGRVFDGSIFRIATTAEATTRTFRTELEIDNSEALLKPGMIARAALVRKSYPEAITVPLFSVITRENARFVFVEADGTAQQRMIDVGFFQSGQVYVPQGLRDGDRLIVAGQRDLEDGQRIAVGRETN